MGEKGVGKQEGSADYQACQGRRLLEVLVSKDPIILYTSTHYVICQARKGGTKEERRG
jgi:hypothetical protein